MNKALALSLIIALTLVIPALAADNENPQSGDKRDQRERENAKSSDKKPYDPVTAYTVKTVRGWEIHVNNRLLNDHAKTAAAALELLDVKLYDITRILPAAAVAKLREVPIWLEVRDKYNRHPCACYHPDRNWLIEHGYNPAKAKAVEIANTETFIAWTRQQPWMVLHELAHAYHDRVLGFENEKIVAAYEQAVKDKQYESVLRWSGKTARHYALNNPREYFAEATEAYYGTNDFFPFVRAELKKHDAGIHDLMDELWKAK